jgi:hypothetical protein
MFEGEHLTLDERLAVGRAAHLSGAVGYKANVNLAVRSRLERVSDVYVKKSVSRLYSLLL